MREYVSLNMGNPAGVRRDFEALEQRRLAAVKLWRQGLGNTDVAQRLGVTRQTVVRWARQHRKCGRAGLETSARAGRPCRINGAQREQLMVMLLQGPEALGYCTPLWTCPRVADLMEREFGISYHAAHVWKILRELGWSAQQSTGRACERNERRIQDWKRKTWPGLKKAR